MDSMFPFLNGGGISLLPTPAILLIPRRKKMENSMGHQNDWNVTATARPDYKSWK